MKFKNTKEQYARRKFIAEAAEIVPQENLRTHTANVQQQQTRNRHLTVIYNPVSGKKKAKNIIDKLVIPMFKASHTDYKIIPTEFSGHGIKLMEELDITQTDGVLVAGGDGMVQECVTGAMRLPQPPAMGIIPCGSGNAMANDLDQFISETESELIGRVVLAAIENKKQPVDVIGCFPLEPAIVEAFQSSSCVSSRSSEFSSGHNQDADSAAGAVAVTAAAAAAAADINDKTNNNNNNANDNNHNSNNSNSKSKLVPAPIFSTTNNTKMVNYNRNLELNRLNDLSSPCSSPCDSLSSSSDSSSSLKNKVNTMADQQTVFGSPCSSTTDTLSQSTQSLDQLLLHGPTNNAALNGNITAQTTTITTTKAATAAAAAATATATATATITATTSNTNNNTTNNTAATLTATLTATTEDENIIPGYYSSSMSDTDSETEADIQETIKVNSAPATGVSNAYATTNTTTSITNKSIYDSKNNDDKKDDKNIYNYKNKAQNTFQQQQQQQQQQLQQLQPQQQPQQQQHLSPSVTLNLNEKNDTVTIEESQEARKNAFFGLSVFGYGIGGAITKAAESLRWLPGRKTLRYDIAGLKTFATEWPIHCPVRISLPKDAREHFYSTNTKQQHGQAALTAEGDLLQHGWITRSTQLVNLIATKLPVLAQGNPVAPGVSRADGRIALTMIEGPQGRFAMMRSGFNMKRGKYLASDKSSTTVYVKEFIITPLDPDSTIEYLIDGDSKPAEPLHVKIFHHALTLFANPRYNDNWV